MDGRMGLAVWGSGVRVPSAPPVNVGPRATCKINLEVLGSHWCHRSPSEPAPESEAMTLLSLTYSGN
jgi:hypothetical protein